LVQAVVLTRVLIFLHVRVTLGILVSTVKFLSQMDAMEILVKTMLLAQLIV
jgi:hypothetical protein